MDSTNPQSGPSSSLRSNRKRKSNTAEMGKSKKAKFLTSYIRQRFSLPDSIMLYIAKNPLTPEVYQNLLESCKYFFVKNKVLVISRLLHYGDHSRGYNGRMSFDLNKNGCKFWISDEFDVGPQDLKSNSPDDQDIVTSVLPKLYRCDAKNVTLFNQVISYRDLSLFISSAENIYFYNTAVKDKNGSNVAFEKIVEVAVKAKWIEIEKPTITSKSMEELIQIPHFAKLVQFTMSDISEDFDLKVFYDYMKTNKQTKFYLRFDDSISDACKTRVEETVDEVLATEIFDYKPPLIYFAGMNEQKNKQLRRLICRN